MVVIGFYSGQEDAGSHPVYIPLEDPFLYCPPNEVCLRNGTFPFDFPTSMEYNLRCSFLRIRGIIMVCPMPH